jgi:hypothetical protein
LEKRQVVTAISFICCPPLSCVPFFPHDRIAVSLRMEISSDSDVDAERGYSCRFGPIAGQMTLPGASVFRSLFHATSFDYKSKASAHEDKLDTGLHTVDSTPSLSASRRMIGSMSVTIVPIVSVANPSLGANSFTRQRPTSPLEIDDQELISFGSLSWMCIQFVQSNRDIQPHQTCSPGWYVAPL